MFRHTLYTHWGDRQPLSNGSTSGCVAIDGNTLQSRDRNGGYWYDLQCNNSFPALCQQTKNLPPATATYPGICPVFFYYNYSVANLLF